jgi:mevalonate kinase
MIYTAKLLLFGEYSVIAGSEALAIPISQFGASWDFSSEANDSHHQLGLMLNHLETAVFNFAHFLNLLDFKNDLNRGIYLKSNIPQGYGLGSSGSVCAAVFDRYKTNNAINLSQIELRTFFAQMENFFHGNSSGIDPLVSFLNNPVVINSDQQLTSRKDCTGFHEKIDVYLYDSKIARKTEPLVIQFNEKLKDLKFQNSLKEELVPLVRSVIDIWLHKGDVLQKIKQISNWQLKNMYEYIPERVLKIWQESKDDPNMVFKLCGAGGGGFFLVFAKKGTSLDAKINQGLIKISP